MWEWVWIWRGIKKLQFHCPVNYRLLLILSHNHLQPKPLLLCLEWNDLHLWSSKVRILFLVLLHYYHDVWPNEGLKKGTWETCDWQSNPTKAPKCSFIIIIGSNEGETAFLSAECDDYWTPICTCLTFRGFLTHTNEGLTRGLRQAQWALNSVIPQSKQVQWPPATGLYWCHSSVRPRHSFWGLQHFSWFRLQRRKFPPH